VGSDVVTFDAEGERADPSTFVLAPARVVLASLLPPDASIDLSTGRGEVPLFHPEVVRGAECSPARCEAAGGKLLVRGISSDVNSVDVRFSLAPKVVFQKKEGSDSKPTAHLAVLHCPMSVASGPPLRSVDGSRLVVRIEERCARDLSLLEFEVDDTPVRVLESSVDAGATYILLEVGRLEKKSISIAALHSQGDGDVIALTHADTWLPPHVRASLEIPGHKNLDFIPNNRPTRVHTPSVPSPGRLFVLPVDGVYHVDEKDPALITGDADAAGLATLRFAYRVESLPGELAKTDLGVLTDPLERSVHEANLPAPIANTVFSSRPMVELICGPTLDGTRVIPAQTAHLDFSRRDDCRLVFHRERIQPEYGTQKLNLSIEVMSADGLPRSEGHVAQTLTLRSGSHPIYAWVHGVTQQFDRVVIRLSHAADEAHYVGAAEIDTGSPAVKWTAIFGRGHARWYATTAIPTGLYRFGDAAHSGVLSLNFGIVSRLTWLDAEGHEGLLGLEAGIMAIGLSKDTGPSGASLTQIGAVAGLGVSIPVANRASPTQASINLHGWLEEDITHRDGGNRFAFILGPSISIGNIGTNL
jgi:hypothetical protein